MCHCSFKNRSKNYVTAKGHSAWGDPYTKYGRKKILIRQAPSYDEVHIIPRNQEGNHLAQSRHQSAVDPLIARARCLRV